MDKSPKDARILIAGDNVGDVEQVARGLAGDFTTVESSIRADAMVADFERFLPDVIVLAFEGLAKSQAYCHGLLRLSRLAQVHPHRTVILCGKDETRDVFELCKKQFFDDYVLYWPQAFDGLRLAMSVWNACTRLAAAREANAGGADHAAQAASAHALGGAVERQPTQGVQYVAAERAPGARSTVLIVEDDAFAAKLIAKALENQPFDLEHAADAPAVLTLLRRIRPRVILMDVNMPGMDGLALTEWLKASPSLAGIPVLMLTGDSRRETIERSKAVGAAGFIVKPFTRDGLLAKLTPFVQ